MNNSDKSFKNFIKIAFPLKNPFLRKEYSWLHNLIKWIAIRLAFLFYRLGISANVLDIIGLFLLIPTYLIIFFSLYNGEIIFFYLSYLVIYFVIGIDFIDGILANISKYKYTVGDDLDNLCPDIVKFFSYFILGYMSESPLFFMVSILVCIITHNFVNKTARSFPDKYKMLKVIFFEKYSINSFRIFVILFIPIIGSIYIYNNTYAVFISKLLILTFFLISIIWIVMSFKVKN